MDAFVLDAFVLLLLTWMLYTDLRIPTKNAHFVGSLLKKTALTHCARVL